MIKITEVTSDYCIKEIDGGWTELVPTDELLDEWGKLELIDKINYYVGVSRQVELDAKEMLNEYFRDTAEDLGFEDGILENMQTTPSDEQIKAIQDILDDISKTSAFTYYEKGQRIEPNS